MVGSNKTGGRCWLKLTCMSALCKTCFCVVASYTTCFCRRMMWHRHGRAAIRRLEIDLERDLWVQERRVNGRSYEAQQQYVTLLEAREVSGEEHCRLVENYLAAKPLRRAWGPQFAFQSVNMYRKYSSPTTSICLSSPLFHSKYHTCLKLKRTQACPTFSNLGYRRSLAHMKIWMFEKEK